jgi:2-polyprenyl-3-methyl-5-hydroxy-6-metoxy-1,4-benzoquinol methylase
MRRTKNWAKWYKEHNPGYNVLTTGQTIMVLIQKITSMGQTFIEWGYGTGYTAIALANLGKSVQAYDIEPGLLPYAMSARAEELINLNGRVGFTCDKQMLRRADIVYSQGLLEHFEPLKVVDLIKEMLSYANSAVVFSVPSENYPQRDFGDEKLLTLEAWEQILQPFADKLTQLFYYERDQHIIGIIRK